MIIFLMMYILYYSLACYLKKNRISSNTIDLSISLIHVVHQMNYFSITNNNHSNIINTTTK